MTVKEHFALLKRAFCFLVSLDKMWVVTMVLLYTLEAASPYIPVFMSAKIVDELIYGKNKEQLGIYIAVTVALTCMVYLLIAVLEKVMDYHFEIYFTNEKNAISKKTMELDYEQIENSKTQQLLEGIKIESMTGHNIGRFVYMGVVTLNAVVSIVFSVGIVVPLFAAASVTLKARIIFVLIIVFGIVINYYANKKKNKIFLKMFDEFVPLNAYMVYVLDHVENYKSRMETQVYGMGRLLSENIWEFHKKEQKISLGSQKRQVKYVVITDFVNALVKFAAYAFVISAALKGGITVGSIAKCVSGTVMLTVAIQETCSGAQALADNNNYLKRYFSFFDIPSNMYHGTLPVEKRAFCDGGDNDYEIEFRDVSFRYPGAEQYALRHVSLKFRIGERMAIVGQNGSGKTTFIKLLCRLYDPTEGQILLNGIDIRKYDYDEYISVFSMVFQDFKLFSFALGQNVASCVDYDKKWAETCLKKAGFGERLEKLPDGLETCLYKDFEENGVEISGGEAQKIAIARALYKDAPFIVLDEPTAALDPVAEYDIYSRFNEMVEDKTAIYISHRLSSCRFCDDIAVFNAGQLVQRGNHDTLISDEGGKYYELWTAQAQYYTENAQNAITA